MNNQALRAFLIMILMIGLVAGCVFLGVFLWAHSLEPYGDPDH